MRNDVYPEGAVIAIIKTDLVTANTAKVLTDRLEKEAVTTPVFLSLEKFEILKSVCARLIPQHSTKQQVDLPGLFDQQLVSGAGNGWRYANLPNDKDAISSGLSGIEEMAKEHYQISFHLLEEVQQDKILQQVQDGTANAKTWEHLPAALFFKDLLSSLVELFFSHPLAKDQVGDASFADAKGWEKIGLEQVETFEPKTIKF